MRQSDKRGESDRKKQRDIAAKSNQRQRDINIQSDVTTKEEGNTTLFCVGKATARRILFFFPETWYFVKRHCSRKETSDRSELSD